MAESPPKLSLAQVGEDSLVVWALASFHAAALTVVPLAMLYLDGAVGDLLAGLETSVGLGLYLALWGLTWWTTRNVLRELREYPEDEENADDASFTAVALVGGKWGGVNGTVFFWVLLAGFAALNLPTELGRALGAVPFLLVAGGVGTVLALGIGGIVGVLFASLDLALVWVARALVPGDSA